MIQRSYTDKPVNYLQIGCIVEFDNKVRALCTEHYHSCVIMGNSFSYSQLAFNDDLFLRTHPERGIVAIYWPKVCQLDKLFEDSNLDLIWKRNEETD